MTVLARAEVRAADMARQPNVRSRQHALNVSRAIVQHGQAQKGVQTHGGLHGRMLQLLTLYDQNLGLVGVWGARHGKSIAGQTAGLLT